MQASRVTNPRGQAPPVVMGHTAHYVQNKVMFFGGYSPSDTACLNNVYTFDVESSKWSRQNSGFPAVYRHASSMLPSNVVYLQGGCSTRGSSQSITRSAGLYSFDPNIGSGLWQQVTARYSSSGSSPEQSGCAGPGARSGHSMTRFDDHSLFLFGGWDGHRIHSDLWHLDTRELIWHKIRRSPSSFWPEPRCRHSSVIVPSGGSDDLLVAFGFSGSETLQDMNMYDPRMEQWRSFDAKIADGFHSRCSATATWFGGAVIFLGGYHKDGAGAQVGILKDGAICDLSGVVYPLDSAIVDEVGPRYGHTTTKLPNNRMLVFGGMGAEPGFNSSNLRKPIVIHYSSKVGRMYERLVNASSAFQNFQENLGGSVSSGAPQPLERKMSGLAMQQHRDTLFEEVSSAASSFRSHSGSFSRPGSGRQSSARPGSGHGGNDLQSTSSFTASATPMQSQSSANVSHFKVAQMRKARLHSLLGRPQTALSPLNPRRMILQERMLHSDPADETFIASQPSGMHDTHGSVSSHLNQSHLNQSDASMSTIHNNTTTTSLNLSRSHTPASGSRPSTAGNLSNMSMHSTTQGSFDDPFTRRFKILKAKATITMKHAFCEEIDVKKVLGKTPASFAKASVLYSEVMNMIPWTPEPELPPNIAFSTKHAPSMPAVGASVRTARKSVYFNEALNGSSSNLHATASSTTGSSVVAPGSVSLRAPPSTSRSLDPLAAPPSILKRPSSSTSNKRPTAANLIEKMTRRASAAASVENPSPIRSARRSGHDREQFDPYRGLPWVTEDMKLIYMGVPQFVPGEDPVEVHHSSLIGHISIVADDARSLNGSDVSSGEDENYWDLFCMAVPMVEKELVANDILQQLEATKLSVKITDEFRKMERASSVISAEEVLRLCLSITDRFDRKFQIQSEFERRPEDKRHKQVLASCCRRIGFQIKELAVQHIENHRLANRRTSIGGKKG